MHFPWCGTSWLSCSASHGLIWISGCLCGDPTFLPTLHFRNGKPWNVGIHRNLLFFNIAWNSCTILLVTEYGQGEALWTLSSSECSLQAEKRCYRWCGIFFFSLTWSPPPFLEYKLDKDWGLKLPLIEIKCDASAIDTVQSYAGSCRNKSYFVLGGLLTGKSA